MAQTGDKWACFDDRNRRRTAFFNTQAEAVTAGTNILLGVGTVKATDDPALAVVLLRPGAPLGAEPNPDEILFEPYVWRWQRPSEGRMLKAGELRYNVAGTVDLQLLTHPDNKKRSDSDV